MDDYAEEPPHRHNGSIDGPSLESYRSIVRTPPFATDESWSARFGERAVPIDGRDDPSHRAYGCEDREQRTPCSVSIGSWNDAARNSASTRMRIQLLRILGHSV